MLFGCYFLLRPQVLKSLFSANYLPHRYCYLVQPGLVWTNVSTDSLIALSYMAIFACLLWVAHRLRDLPDYRRYLWIALAFASFIVACGATHVMEVVTVWVPLYPLSAAFKVLCAMVSVPTAVLFAWWTPRLVRDLREMIALRARLLEERDWARRDLEEEARRLAEREHSARELEKVNVRLNAVMNSTTDGILKVGYDWKVAYGNRAASEYLPDLREGRDLWECFPALRTTDAEMHLRTVMQDRVTAEYENFYAPYDQWFKTHASPVDGGISIFFADITREKQLQDALQKERWLRDKRIQALSNMAGGLAHEISNPLAIIHAQASDLKAAASSNESVAVDRLVSVSDSIVRTSERAMRILSGLRGFGRNAAKDAMELASLYEIVNSCVELQETRLERHAIKLRQHLPDGLPYLYCREVQIGQIVTNLLNNAFDAILGADSSERWIELTVALEDQCIVLDVTDGGPGIAAEVREHLMEPFFTTKEADLGMGVGLSLSRAIAEDHGGTLTLLAGTEHTRFRLSIPALGAEDQEPHPGS